MSNQTRFTEIESYLDGKMTPAQQQAFEARMATDKSLAQDVADSKTATNALKDEQLLDFVLALNEVQEAHDHEAAGQQQPAIGKRIRLSSFWWRAAAAVLLLVVAGGTWYWYNQAPTTNATGLYVANFSPYPAQALRNNATNYPQALTEALQLYRDEKYQPASAALQVWQHDSLHATMATFYRAQALMAGSQVKQAIPLLKGMVAGQQTVFTQSAQWYLLLAYLQQQNTAAAQQQANQILAVPQHAYTQQTQLLLQQLNQL